MPAQNGRLKAEDEAKIRVHYLEIKKNIDGADFIDEFYSKGVFTLEDMEDIKAEKTPLARADLFLSKLFHSGPNGAYTAFLEVINNKYKPLADKFKDKISTLEYPNKYCKF